MAKVTSKLQVTLPKALAAQYGIQPGDDIEFLASGALIRIVPPARKRQLLDPAHRLRLFDEATERQRRRDEQRGPGGADAGRGWTREELYDRGRPR